MNYQTDDFRNIVVWNNEEGLETTSGHILSPATGLEHEFDHAVDWDKDAYSHNKRALTPNSYYDNEEEKRVITDTEQKQAQKNKEIMPGEHTRKDHKGKEVRVKDATSNIPKIY